MTTKKLTKLLALYLPYILLGLVATNIGEAWRLAEGKELGDKIMSMMGTIPVAFANPLPSLHPLDLLVGLCCGAGLWLAVYLRGKNAKKYGIDYAIRKDTSEVPPRYLVFFKAPDAEAFHSAFKEYSASLLNKDKRPSVLARLQELVQAAELPGKVRHKEQERGL